MIAPEENPMQIDIMKDISLYKLEFIKPEENRYSPWKSRQLVVHAVALVLYAIVVIVIELLYEPAD